MMEDYYVQHEEFSYLQPDLSRLRNQGKIESHKWFFKGFCRQMDPIYAQIIDCGSIPLWNSISQIIMHMETFKDVGGACGEIECILAEKKEDGKEAVSFVESVLLRAQYVEYKVSHYMDKATESLFGFVSVLPGAFSTFRWECINGAPLHEFLKGCKDEFQDVTSIMS
jgi:chitin synthase